MVDQNEVIRQFLEPEIADGLVEPPITLNGATKILIRTVANDGKALFASAKADVQPRYTEALERVAKALNTRPGTVWCLAIRIIFR